MTLEEARAQDAADPLRSARERFRLPDGVIYLDGNSLGAMPKATSARLAEVVERQWGEDLITSWNRHGWIDWPTQVAAKLAPIVGASPDELLMADSTSVCLFKLLGAALAARPNRKVMDFKLQVLAAEIIIYTLSVKFPGINVGQGDARVKMLINIRELGSTDHALFELLGKGRGMIVDAKPSFKKFIPGLTYGNWSAKYGKGNEHSFATDVEMDAADFAGPAFFNFDLLNRTLSFGPTKGFFGSQKKIRNLSFGPTADANILKYAEASCFCEMNIVDSAPAWAH